MSYSRVRAYVSVRRGIGSNHSGYDAALLIDRISFTAGTLRAYSTPPDQA
ncbi:hypothetical protein [Mycobacteroides abscessus]|nr:hypothetical protein [Mycobacteroides abscessus]